MCKELTDTEFLYDLAKRRCPMKYGPEQRDAERLRAIADRIKMKQFKIHWLNNQHEQTIVGTDIKDAFSRVGYGAGAMAALDYWEEVTNEKT
jgi:hypothetical protein